MKKKILGLGALALAVTGGMTIALFNKPKVVMKRLPEDTQPLYYYGGRGDLEGYMGDYLPRARGRQFRDGSYIDKGGWYWRQEEGWLGPFKIRGWVRYPTGSGWG